MSIFLVWTSNPNPDIAPSGSFDVRSSSQADFSLLYKIRGDHSIDFLSNATDVFMLVLHGLNPVGQQHQLLSSIDSLLREVLASAASIRSLERQLEAHRPALESAMAKWLDLRGLSMSPSVRYPLPTQH